MKFRHMFTLSAALILTLGLAQPCQANDSEAETSLGGLVLKQNDQISMDSEDLFISAKQVRVKYRFTNHSDRDVRALVAFPLPPQPDFSEDYYDEGYFSTWDDLKFDHKSGRRKAYRSNEETSDLKLMVKTCPRRLTELGLPLKWFARLWTGWRNSRIPIPGKTESLESGRAGF